MNIVQIHIGTDLPDYFWISVEQVRRFFPGNIHVVIPDKHVSDNAVRRIGVHPVACEYFYKNPFYERFLRSCSLEGFWNVTMGRLIMLQLLIMEKFLLNVVHIENDVLIYTNPEKFLPQFKAAAGSSVLLCPVGQNHASAAYLYARNFQAMNKLNSLFINYFERGSAYIKKYMGDDVSEMTMMSHYHRDKRDIIKYLPIMPEGRGSENFGLFKSCFDGASAGQYIGGTQSDGPGWAGNHHYLGVELLKKKYSFEWRTENGIRIPFMRMGKHTFRMNNLHIHSKKLKDFV